MKILVITQYFYPEKVAPNEICFGLARKGHEVTVLTGLPNYPEGEIFTGYKWDEMRNIEKSGIKRDTTNIHFDRELDSFVETLYGVKTVRTRLLPRGKTKPELFKNFKSFQNEAGRVAEIMARLQNNPDYQFDRIIAFQHAPVTAVQPAAIFRRVAESDIPIDIYCFEPWPIGLNSLGVSTFSPTYFFMWLAAKRLYQGADHIWLESKAFENYFEKKFGIRAEINRHGSIIKEGETVRLVYLPSPDFEIGIGPRKAVKNEKTDSNREDNTDLNTESMDNLKRSEETFRQDEHEKVVESPTVNFMFIDTMSGMQSPETVIRACGIIMKKGYKFMLHMVGDGTEYNKLIELADSLELSDKYIKFHGEYESADLPRFFRKADAFILSQKKDGFLELFQSNFLKSFMRYGKPIIAAIDGESARIVRNAECGFVSPSEDASMLARNLERFQDATMEARENQGENGMKYWEENFSEDVFFADLEELLEGRVPHYMIPKEEPSEAELSEDEIAEDGSVEELEDEAFEKFDEQLGEETAETAVEDLKDSAGGNE